MKYPKWPIYAKSLHKTELSNFTKNKIVLSPMHGAGGSAETPKLYYVIYEQPLICYVEIMIS